MHNIAFDPETERRLKELAADKGLSPDDLIREAVAEHLEEIVEAEEAERAYRRYQRGEEDTVNLTEPWRED